VILLQTRAGENFVLASSLLSPEATWQYAQEPSWGRQVVQEGVLRPETLGNYRIIQDGTRMSGLSVERMTDLKDYQMQPHPFVSRVPRPTPSGTVEQVELIYYTDVAPENVPASVAIRPIWRFSGHTSDGRLFEALVDATRQNTAGITLDALSGQPNPTWKLSSAEASDLKALLTTTTLTSTPATSTADGVLGYRGMLIDLPDATTGAAQQWRVFNGVITGQGATWTDPQRRVERWLLRSGVGGFDNALYATISQQIDAALPETWTATLPLSDLSAEEPSPSWNDSDLFFLMLVNGQPVALNRKDPHPGGCLITWDEPRQRLVEPCLGSEYDRHGMWLSGPSLQDMNRFPARVNGARVEVDFTRTVEGTFRG
jgi:nitrite reductase/ring-hydroxylating ferredoxin subunit